MIFSQNSKTNVQSDWHNYFSTEVVTRLNMAPDGDFISCGQLPEPQRRWDQEAKAYVDDDVVAYGYWVCQRYVDEESGEIFRQNPILVIVEGEEQKIQFGEKVRFSGLAGYYSRKKRSYSFRADSVEAVK